MIDILKNSIPELMKNWDTYKDLFKEIRVESRTVLLREGEVAQKIFFIKEGCLRMSYYSRGRDITFQFFFEGQAVSSIESFTSNQPSQFAIESIEPSVLTVVHKKDFEELAFKYPEIKYKMQEIIIKRLSRYALLFLSFIKDTPKQRYLDLLKNEPQIIQRVPQHYIASYLGITPVSLSRIRRKVSLET